MNLYENARESEKLDTLISLILRLKYMFVSLCNEHSIDHAIQRDHLEFLFY